MKTLIGSCTRHNKTQFEKSPTYESMLNGFKHDTDGKYEFYEGSTAHAVIKTNNTECIGKHYNMVIEMAIKEDYDCVVLMHDDVYIDDCGWLNKIEDAYKTNDVVGLAGAKQVSIKPPVLWHLMSTQEDWSGAVAHPAQANQIFMTSFGPTPARCLVLDGLFLAIKVSSITDDIRFDENIPGVAHHYDIDFSLNANKHKLKLTTWPIWAIHGSPGLEKVTTDFKDSEQYMINKWGQSNR